MVSAVGIATKETVKFFNTQWLGFVLGAALVLILGITLYATDTAFGGKGDNAPATSLNQQPAPTAPEGLQPQPLNPSTISEAPSSSPRSQSPLAAVKPSDPALPQTTSLQSKDRTNLSGPAYKEVTPEGIPLQIITLYNDKYAIPLSKDYAAEIQKEGIYNGVVGFQINTISPPYSSKEVTEAGVSIKKINEHIWALVFEEEYTHKDEVVKTQRKEMIFEYRTHQGPDPDAYPDGWYLKRGPRLIKETTR